MTKRKIHPDLLPANLIDVAPPAVREAMASLGSALEADEVAGASLREAELAVQAAPDVDDAALATAVKTGKPSPAPTKPLREAELEGARRRRDKAVDLASKAADGLTVAIVQHREKLVSEQRPLVESAAAEAAEALDLLSGRLERLAREAGVLHALHNPRTGSPEQRIRAARSGRSRVELPAFDAFPMPDLEPLRIQIEELRRDATPLHARVVEAIGDGPTSWQDAAARLGVRVNDLDACQIRDLLVDQQAIHKVDRNGIPLAGRGRFGLLLTEQPCYARVTQPRLTPVQQARLEAKQRAAA